MVEAWAMVEIKSKKKGGRKGSRRVEGVRSCRDSLTFSGFVVEAGDVKVKVLLRRRVKGLLVKKEEE